MPARGRRMRRSGPSNRVDIVVAALAVLLFLGPPAASWAGVAGSRHDFTITNGTSLDKGGRLHPVPQPALRALRPRGVAAGHERARPGGAVLFPGRRPELRHASDAALLRLPRRHDGRRRRPATRSPGTRSRRTSPSPGPAPTPRGGKARSATTRLKDGTLPTGLPGGGPVDGSPTGGHYWKTLPSLTSGFERGDKIPCSLCHDPHNAKTGTAPNENDVFFRSSTTDYEGGTPIDLGKYVTTSGHQASLNTRWGTVGNGRTMCAECHRYSDSPPAETLPTIAGIQLTKPPTNIVQHQEFEHRGLHGLPQAQPDLRLLQGVPRLPAAALHALRPRHEQVRPVRGLHRQQRRRGAPAPPRRPRPGDLRLPDLPRPRPGGRPRGTTKRAPAWSPRRTWISAA